MNYLGPIIVILRVDWVLLIFMKSHAKNLEDSIKIEGFTGVLAEALKIPILSVISRALLVSPKFVTKMEFSSGSTKTAVNRSIWVESPSFFACDFMNIRRTLSTRKIAIIGPKKFGNFKFVMT